MFSSSALILTASSSLIKYSAHIPHHQMSQLALNQASAWETRPKLFMHIFSYRGNWRRLQLYTGEELCLLLVTPLCGSGCISRPQKFRWDKIVIYRIIISYTDRKTDRHTLCSPCNWNRILSTRCKLEATAKASLIQQYATLNLPSHFKKRLCHLHKQVVCDMTLIDAQGQKRRLLTHQ